MGVNRVSSVSCIWPYEPKPSEHTHTHTHTCTRTRTRTDRYAHACTRTHMIHTRVHASAAHSHIHMHTHAQSRPTTIKSCLSGSYTVASEGVMARTTCVKLRVASEPASRTWPEHSVGSSIS